MPVEEASRRLATRVEASGPLVRGIRVGPPKTVLSKRVFLWVRELQGVDGANRAVGPAYRLEYDDVSRIHDLKDSQGAPLASEGGRDWRWAQGHAAHDMRARGQAAGLKGFRIGPGKTHVRDVPVHTERELQPVDAETRPVGRPYVLVKDSSIREQEVLDPDGAELCVVGGKGFDGAEYGLRWAERVVERDLRRGPERALRSYEVSAEVDGGPRDRDYLGTERVEAGTSAEALDAVPPRRFAGGLDPEARGVHLGAVALEDFHDRSHVTIRVPARERGGGRGQPERAVSFER